MLSARLDKHFIKKHAYLFAINVSALAEGFTLERFEANNLASAKALFSAYGWAFAQKLHGELSLDFVCGVHAAVNRLSDDVRPGQIKKGPNYYGIIFPNTHYQSTIMVKNSKANGTYAGLMQFYQDWLLNAASPLHFLHFKTGDVESYVTPLNASGQRGLWYQTHVKRKTPEGLPLPMQVNIYDLHQNDTGMQRVFADLCNRPIFCYVNAMGNDQLKLMGYQASIHEMTQAKLSDIIVRYNTEIKLANTDDEKLAVIARSLQHISQLHPFDRVMRFTIYVLLNRLLEEEKMTMALLVNPQRFEMCSHAEVVATIKDGQENFRIFISGKTPAFHDRIADIPAVIESQDIPDCQDEIVAFIEAIEQNMRTCAIRARQENLPSTLRFK